MYVLGYDIGSSSVKASLVNVESGKCMGLCRAETGKTDECRAGACGRRS